MGYIYCIIGKSGSGKDTVLENLLHSDIDITKIVPYTTRPKRENECDGIQYHFVSQKQLQQMEEEGQVIEKRVYNTVHGEWTYFTSADKIDEDKDYIIITTQKALNKFFEKFGEEKIYVLYLKLDDKERLLRCISREAMEDTPNYKEVCRRFLTDEEDFDESELKSYKNCSVIDTMCTNEECAESIVKIIKRQK